MRIPAQVCAAIGLLVIVPCSALAGKRQVDGLVFQPVKAAGSECINPAFRFEQEPGPFFKGLTKTESHGVVKFRRGKAIMENFPDELMPTVLFGHKPGQLENCPVSTTFDPATVKFRAEWRGGSQSRVAEGVVVSSEHSHPGLWCKDSCEGLWLYELRIESRGVPLTDQLFVTVNAENGDQLEQRVGTLGPAQLRITPELGP